MIDNKELTHIFDILTLQLNFLQQAEAIAEQFARELAANTSIMYKQKAKVDWLRSPPIVALEELGPRMGALSFESPPSSLVRCLQEARHALGVSNESNTGTPHMLNMTEYNHYRIGNRVINVENGKKIMQHNFVYRILAKFTIDLCAEMDSLCESEGCDLHLQGTNNGTLSVVPNPNYFQQVRNVARRVITERCERIIHEAAYSEIRNPSEGLLSRIMGESNFQSLSFTQTTIGDFSLNALRALEKTNPGLVGVWLYGLLKSNDIFRPKAMDIAEHESVIVNWVAEQTGLKPGTMAWKYLARMSAKDAFAFMIRGGNNIHGTAFSSTFEDAKYVLELHAIAVNSPKLKKAAVMRLKSAGRDSTRSLARFGPMLYAYLQQLSKPAAKRGMTVAELNIQLTDMIDWANSVYWKHFARNTQSDDCTCLDEDKPDCVVIPNERWSSLQRRSEAWHQEQIIKAQAKSSEKPSESWESLVEKYDDGTYTVLPLTTDVDLAVEGATAHHCVGSYSPACLRGASRVFSVVNNSTRSRAKNPTNHVATIELKPSKHPDGKRYWRLGQVQGHRSRTVSSVVHQVAKRLAHRYTEAAQDTADQAVA